MAPSISIKRVLLSKKWMTPSMENHTLSKKDSINVAVALSTEVRSIRKPVNLKARASKSSPTAPYLRAIFQRGMCMASAAA